MKERTNAKTDSPTTGDTGVVELTPDMVVANPSQIQIIELTNPLDSPDATTTPQARARSAVESTEPAADRDAAVRPADGLDVIEAKAVEPAEPVADMDADAMPAAESDTIEEEVDAAFKQAQIETAARVRYKAEQEQLLDKLTDLTDMVDGAVRDTSDRATGGADPASDDGAEPPSRDTSDDDHPAPMDETEVDADQLARDAALLDAAMTAEPTDDAVESTDRVDPAEPDFEVPLGPVTLETEQDDEDLLAMIDLADLPTSSAEAHGEPSVEAAEEDDIIELTDIVNPAELEQSAASVATVEAPDEAIIELTDIVDPAELQQTDVSAAPVEAQDEEIIELTDIVDPAVLQRAATPDEDLIELTDIVDPETVREALTDERPGSATDDDIIELTDIVDPAGLEPSAVFARSTPTAEDEPMIRLTDVLDDPARKDRPAKDNDPLR